MNSPGSQPKAWVLLTGATGLLGSAVLKELLGRGQRVLCVVRASAPAEARGRLADALAAWEAPADSFFETGQLVAVRGDISMPQLGLSEAVVLGLHEMVGSVVHVAGSTAFATRADAGLVRTNVDGTRRVFELAAACECKDWHLFSTAYVCGGCERAEETLFETRPAFRNEYEWSKWTAEQQTFSAARRIGASATVYRPSVIVGDSETGAITRFSGVYRVFRAVALLARVAEQRGDFDRHHIPLRIPADRDARPNLVFVDDVAREFAELFAQPLARGRVFHLTHPDPPTNGAIQKALEEYYDIGGGRFVGARQPIPKAQRTPYEDIFFDIVLDTEPYILEAPVFDRSRADLFVSRRPTPWNQERLRSQIHFAERSAWRPRRGSRVAGQDLAGNYADYFEQFVPRAHHRFRLSQVASLDLNVRYVIGGSAEGDWFCRYRGGRLIDVARTNGITPDVTYRIASGVFWRIVRGQSTTADSFLSGNVQIEGNIERGLKFAAILQEFVREFPYSPTAQGQNAS